MSTLTNGNIWQRVINLLNTILPNKTVTKVGLTQKILINWPCQKSYSHSSLDPGTRKKKKKTKNIAFIQKTQFKNCIFFSFCRNLRSQGRCFKQFQRTDSNYPFIWIASVLLKIFCTFLYHCTLTIYFVGFYCVTCVYVNLPI